MQTISHILVGENNLMKIYVKASEMDRDELLGYARDPNTSPDMFTKLAKLARLNLKNKEIPINSFEYDIREALAENPNTPSKILAKLVKSVDSSKYESRWILYDIAANPNTPADILWDLSDNKDSFISEGLAYNPQISEDLMKKLLDTRDIDIGQCLVDNPSITESIINILLNPDWWNFSTRWEEIKNMQCLIKPLEDNPKAPKDILAELKEEYF